MLKFDKTCEGALKKFIYESHIHDAMLKDLQYDSIHKTVSMQIINLIHNSKMSLHFLDVEIFLRISGSEWGDKNTILSLTIEDDCSQIKDCERLGKKVTNDSIYFLFQMFSGDELHVISREVFIKSC